MQRTMVSQGKLNEYRHHEQYQPSHIFCEICHVCKPISQKRTGQDSRNSPTGLTFRQGVIMQRIRVSQGKLNEYRHHETYKLRNIFVKFANFVSQFLKKRTGQDSRNSLPGLTFNQAVFMPRTRVSQGKLNEYRHHEP